MTIWLESMQAEATKNNQYPGAEKEEKVYCQECWVEIKDYDEEYCDQCKVERKMARAEYLEDR